MIDMLNVCSEQGLKGTRSTMELYRGLSIKEKTRVQLNWAGSYYSNYSKITVKSILLIDSRKDRKLLNAVMGYKISDLFNDNITYP